MYGNLQKAGGYLMKKILKIALAAVMVFSAFGALAEDAQVVTLGGVVLESTETTVLIHTDEYGDVLVNYDETTVFEGLEAVEPDTYIIVTYSGAMTRSIPPQIFAEKISMFVVSGTVTEVTDAGVLVDQGELGPVLVHLQDGMEQLFYGCVVDVYYSGVMAMSYPGQITALYVVTPTLPGTVSELGDGYFLMMGEDGQTYMVNNDDGTHLDEALNVGDSVKVIFNGAMAKSMPPQIYAIAVSHIDQ
jgi:hypothetical protein